MPLQGGGRGCETYTGYQHAALADVVIAPV